MKVFIDVLMIVVSVIAAYGLFVGIFFVVGKWIFPRIEEEDLMMNPPLRKSTQIKNLQKVQYHKNIPV